MHQIVKTLGGALIVALSLIPLKTTGQPIDQRAVAHQVEQMKIKIIIDGNTADAVLEDNPVSRDLYSLLPVTANFQDIRSEEKIAYLPRKLSIKNNEANYEAKVWDITYYVPGGNLAIFYKDYVASKDLAKLGRIVSGNVFLTRSRTFRARIERADP